MADLTIKRIKIRNWATVRSADLEFPSQGLVLVIGSNLASKGKLQSVGAGKTALGEALSRTLVGVKGRYTELGYFYRDNAKDGCYVRVEGELKSKPLTVEIGYKCNELSKTGEGLRFEHGDWKIHGNLDVTRQELAKTLSVSPELAEWTVFLDGPKLRFNGLSQEGAVGLLMTSLAQPPWTDYHENALKKLQKTNNHVAASSNSLNAAHAQVEEARRQLQYAESDLKEAKEEYQRKLEAQEREIQRLTEQNSADKSAARAASAEIEKIAKKRKLLEEKGAKDAHDLEIEIGSLRDKRALADKAWKDAVAARSERKADWNKADEILGQMLDVPKVCPTCQKPWDKAHSEEELKKANERCDKKLIVYETANDLVKKLSNQLAVIDEELNGLLAKVQKSGHVADIKALGENHEKNERLIRKLTAAIHERELQIQALGQVEKSSVDKIEAKIEERKRSLEETKAKVQSAASELAADEEVAKIVNYWYRAFSPVGIPNMILTEAIPALNNVARRISVMMTGGSIVVSYSTVKTLAKGDQRPKLNISVENKLGAKRIEGSSKGESGLTNLIVAETLSEIGLVSKRVGFRWYDEITNGQDLVVRQSIFAYLKEMAHRLGILIFVVDHYPEAASYADHVLVAEKTDEHGTRYFFK